MKSFQAAAAAAAVVLWAGVGLGLFGCNFADDDEPEPTGSGGTEGGGPATLAECAAAAAVSGVQSMCEPGQDFWVDWDGADYNMTLIDDPVANVGVGPNGWLIQASSSADWIGDYEGSDGDCQYGCGWCQPGQSVCHGGFDTQGYPVCMLCLAPEAGDFAAQVAACAAFTANPTCEGGTPPGGGDDGTTGGSDSRVDDSGGFDETGVEVGYDCGAWDVAAAAIVSGKAIEIDEAILEEVVQYFGSPLSDCDGTRFSRDAEGYFVLTKNSETGLLSQMGLVVGDRIETLNGSKITSADQAVNLVVKLFLSGTPAKKFSLGVRRTVGRSKVFTEYRVNSKVLPR